MLLIFIATMVAVLAAAVCGRLASAPTARQTGNGATGHCDQAPSCLDTAMSRKGVRQISGGRGRRKDDGIVGATAQQIDAIDAGFTTNPG